MAFPKVFWYFTWGFFFNNCAFNVLSQLQSSINPTVGPISLSLQFASSIIVCLVIAPILFSTTGTRFQFTIASLGYLVYAIANFVPSWYTLIPAAVILGFATGISWAGATLFVPTMAIWGRKYFCCLPFSRQVDILWSIFFLHNMSTPFNSRRQQNIGAFVVLNLHWRCTGAFLFYQAGCLT